MCLQPHISYCMWPHGARDATLQPSLTSLWPPPGAWWLCLQVPHSPQVPLAGEEVGIPPCRLLKCKSSAQEEDGMAAGVRRVEQRHQAAKP